MLPAAPLAAQPTPQENRAPDPGSTVKLDDFTVEETEDNFDSTGMGTVEAEMGEEPFANELIQVSDYAMDGDGLDIGSELNAVAESSPADRVAGEDRLNLRGFPTPALRNSFIQVGIPETLNTGQTIVIQGALVPVVGRAAPGGIQNFMTARPRATQQTRTNAWFSSLNRQRATYEYVSPVVKKKTWQRVALEWQRRIGPEAFAREETRAVYTSLTWKHSRSASTLFALDFRQTSAQASPGIPEYRVNAATKIAGPYLPLAEFNANGPEAGVRRRSAAASIQYDGQPTKALAVRASLEGWWRTVEQDRFTTSVLNLATGLFEGTREPRHLEQPQAAIAAQAEATLRFRSLQADHKAMVSASHTWGHYRREERSLNTADRNALPLDVRRFNPFAPNFYRPAFDPVLYGRVNTDRAERARYVSAEISDRMAWRRGLIVATAGLRYDEVAIEIEDRLPTAARPRLTDSTRQFSYHSGVNYQLIRNRLLGYATVSTAFDPSTPVDARTGRIQDNETTLGYETGLRGRALAGKLDYSAGGFLLYNEHIARRNPLYNDPIADANQTQPQLVAAGEERFSGARLELRWTPAKTMSLQVKATATRAITTASPDLPQEVGRPITRLPSYQVAANFRHRPAAWTGFSWGVNWQYLDGYVATYEDTRRAFLDYPGYGLLHASAGYDWRIKKRQFGLEAGVRNLLDRDLLASHARLAAGRELTLSLRATF